VARSVSARNERGRWFVCCSYCLFLTKIRFCVVMEGLSRIARTISFHSQKAPQLIERSVSGYPSFRFVFRGMVCFHFGCYFPEHDFVFD
jgi:hypothetical protein